MHAIITLSPAITELSKLLATGTPNMRCMDAEEEVRRLVSTILIAHVDPLKDIFQSTTECWPMPTDAKRYLYNHLHARVIAAIVYGYGPLSPYHSYVADWIGPNSFVLLSHPRTNCPELDPLLAVDCAYG